MQSEHGGLEENNRLIPKALCVLCYSKLACSSTHTQSSAQTQVTGLNTCQFYPPSVSLLQLFHSFSALGIENTYMVGVWKVSVLHMEAVVYLHKRIWALQQSGGCVGAHEEALNHEKNNLFF